MANEAASSTVEYDGTDTTVYTISAGYVPTLGFRKSDFQMGRSVSGKMRQTPNGKRYDGNLASYGDAIGRDGSLAKARLRGSVAWYEFSTTVRAVNKAIKKDRTGLMEAQMEEWSKTWFGTSHVSDSKKLVRDVNSELIKFKPTKGKTVSADTNKNVTPEEQKVYGSKLKKVLVKDRVGLTNSIDLYMRNADGNIYRLDVTAMTMDSKGMMDAHHGLSSYEDRKAKGMLGKDLITKYGKIKKGAHDKVYDYFKGVQNSSWNPPIVKLKKRIMEGQNAASNLLKELSAEGGKTLSDLKGKDANFINKLRQGGRSGAAAAQIKGNVTKKGRTYEQLIAKAFQKKGEQQAFASGLEFALHMLGNVLEIFRSDSARQGGYSTGYTVGEGVAKNFVIEVQHNIHATGEQVFEFKDLMKSDVMIHSAQTLSDVYRNQLWTEDGVTNHLTHEQIHRNQNEQHTVQLLTSATGTIDIGTLAASGGEDMANGDIIHKSASMIAPENVNKKINEFIAGLSSKANRKTLQSFLRKRLLNKTDKARKMHSVGNFGSHKRYSFGQDSQGLIPNRIDDDKRPWSLFSTTGTQAPVRKGKYWGLNDYIKSRAIKDDFNDKVKPTFWAAPYISLLYPSTQV